MAKKIIVKRKRVEQTPEQKLAIIKKQIADLNAELLICDYDEEVDLDVTLQLLLQQKNYIENIIDCRKCSAEFDCNVCEHFTDESNNNIHTKGFCEYYYQDINKGEDK